VENPKVLVY